MIERNCNQEQRFRAKARVPDSTGALATPSAAGAVTGLLLRLASDPTTLAAIHANVEDLAASEEAGEVGTFYVLVSQSLMQTHVLPLGVGAMAYEVWYKTGTADYLVRPFLVSDRTVIA